MFVQKERERLALVWWGRGEKKGSMINMMKLGKERGGGGGGGGWWPSEMEGSISKGGKRRRAVALSDYSHY